MMKRETKVSGNVSVLFSKLMSVRQTNMVEAVIYGKLGFIWVKDVVIFDSGDVRNMEGLIS
jgi:hypothetical protein